MMRHLLFAVFLCVVSGLCGSGSWVAPSGAADAPVSPLPRLKVDKGERGNIAVLRAEFPGTDQAVIDTIAARLRQTGFGVTRLSAEQVCDPRILSARQFFLYVIPDCRTYPAAGLETLLAYAGQQGHVLWLGGPFLDNPLWNKDGRWRNRQDMLEARKQAKPVWFPFGIKKHNTEVWSRNCNDRRVPASWKVESEGPDGQPCFKFWTKNVTGWDGYRSPDTRAVFGKQHDLLTLMAKGDAHTPQLAVEIQEKDGSRWFATVDIETRWQRIALSTRQFQYWPDGSPRHGRGGKGDHLRPENAVRVIFQLAHSHTPDVPAGEHSFCVADIGTCVDPASVIDVSGKLVSSSLETIYPRYKVYELRDSVALQSRKDSPILAGSDWPTSSDTVCAIPRTMGRGYQRQQKWRYIRILDALDDDKPTHGPDSPRAKLHSRGSPAWLLINRAGPMKGSLFACIGLDESESVLKVPISKAATDIVERISKGAFLAEAGTEHFSYWPGEPVKIGAVVVNVADVDQTVTLQVAVRDPKKQVRFSRMVQLDVPARNRAEWQDELILESFGPGVCRISVELVKGQEKLDQITHDLTVLETKLPDKDEFLTVRGNDFYLKNRKWYPVGINYWPLYVSGMDHKDYWSGWLTRSYYEPNLVEQDLARMESLGINLVSIQSHAPSCYRNLLDFLDRCRRHQIRVNLFCALASPLAFREKELREFVRTARLAENPTVIAYDTIWEPGNYVFRKDWRKRWDVAWRAWVVQQYGSIEAAEKDWHFKARCDDAGRLVSPPDRQFREDGPWRIVMAAYRRFMDDLTSRKWNRATRRLRQIDPIHLISFRQGNTLPHDFAFTGTPKHVDFMCPEGYSIRPDGYYAAGFITRYVHFTTGGKPIVWSEFGQSVWDSHRMSPSAKRILAVADYHEMFYRMVLESGANGTIPWWWPGGYRVGERSDYGIVNPDGTPRPAAQLIQKYGPKMKNARYWPAPTTWFTIDRDAHAGGYWHVCFGSGRDAYRDAVRSGGNLGIRTTGTGTTSADTPMIAVGNQPCTGHNPPKYLNAEFNEVLVWDADGQWVDAEEGIVITVPSGKAVRCQISVGNTQEATWIAPREDLNQPGSVLLQTTSQSEVNGRWPLPTNTPYLADADFGEFVLADGITRPTRIELRMVAEGRTEFGEIRSFILKPRKR